MEELAEDNADEAELLALDKALEADEAPCETR
jgi:hypothetical protein